MYRCRNVAVSRTFALCSRNKSAMVSSPELQSNLRELELDSELSSKMPFARAKIGQFFQVMPQLGNQFTEDATLRRFLKRTMPASVYSAVSKDLERFGWRVATDIYELGVSCEKNPPRLEQYNAWGQRVDNIITCEAWKQMKTISAEEGLVAIAYEREFDEYSRLYQMAKGYLFSNSSGLFGCPLGMSDGAAKTFEDLGNKELLDGPFSHLISRDPSKFWTSGQWMTERKGGSDVGGGTQTLAVPQSDGSYRLYGYKWFTSATDSDMSLTLGRIVDENGQHTEGSGGISMFFLETRDSEGNLNNIEIQRLKDKLGTRQLPTAELLLDGTKAYRVSPAGRGVAGITTMLNITRIHNAVWSASAIRRMMSFARDYSSKRFGETIKDYPIHIKNLAHMEVEARAATLFVLEMSRLLGLDDCGLASDHQKDVFRILIPILKLYTAKQAVTITSEGLECFGRAGYLEDTMLPQILRDAQVLPIWEGTTNILSLDTLRAVHKSQGRCLQAFHTDIHQRAAPLEAHPDLKVAAQKVKQAADQIVEFTQKHTDVLQTAAREYSYSLARTFMGVLLLEQAAWEEAQSSDVLAANRWCQQDLVPVLIQQKLGNYDASVSAQETELVYEGYRPTPGSRMYH